LPDYAITPDEHSMAVGASVELNLTKLRDGSWDSAFPESWTSSDQSIATVDLAGLVVGIAPGTVDIGAIVDSSVNEVVFARVTVTDGVSATTMYAVSPEEHSMSADPGSWVQFQLRSSATGSGEWQDATPQYWAIDDESVASIDPASGAATAVGPGTAYVSAVVDADTNQVAFATLTVTGASVPGLTHYVISPEYPSIGIGEWIQLQLRSSVEGSNTWDDASAQSWTIDDTSVATIDPATGAVTAVGEGTANVSAVVDADTNQVAFVQITVTSAV
jgi:hypothetical protein